MNSYGLTMANAFALAMIVGAAAMAAEPAAAPPAASATTGPDTSVSKASIATPPAATDDQASVKAAQELGLKPKKRGNTIVYCRTEASIGTRFETTTCYSKDQLVALAERTRGNREALEEARRKGLAEHASN